MAEGKTMRLGQVARKLNVGISTIADALSAKGFDIESKPNAKIDEQQFQILLSEFESSVNDKKEASGLTIGQKHVDNVVIDSDSPSVKEAKKDDEDDILIQGMTSQDLKSAARKSEPKESAPAAPKKEATPAEKPVEKKAEAPKAEKVEEKKEEAATPEAETPKGPTSGLKVIGKIDLDEKGRPKPKAKAEPKKETKTEPEPAKKAEPKVEEKPEPKTEAPKVAAEKPKEVTPAEKPKEAAAAKPAEQKETSTEKPKVETPAAKKEEAPSTPASKPVETTDAKPEEKPAETRFQGKADTLKGLTVLGKIELPEKKKKAPVASSDSRDRGKRKRKRVRIPGKPGETTSAPARGRAADTRKNAPRQQKEEVTDKEIQEQIKATLAKLSGGSGGKSNSRARSKYRRDKRSAMADARDEQQQQQQADSKTLKVTEFIAANDLASLMNVSVNEVISACMTLGMFVSINQRLDAESITVIADEFGFAVEFTGADDETEIEEVEDAAEDLTDRAPIVTIMGHVDHGKTSLLDYIRQANVTAGEAGGITQHIGAYDVTTESGKRVAFLDTPGHEAFTAMRARGAQVTDIVIIVVAADDGVMPQTKEALNHAQVAGVPIVIAINKIDRPNANPDRIREQLSAINILVEEWGGKYQCQEISAKSGLGVTDLLEKVLLEAEVLELKANADKPAVGTVIEAMLDKGRGYVTTVLVQAGVMKIGDVMLAGSHFGKVKAMYDHRGNRVKEAGPSTPVAVLGLDGAPQAGDRFNVMESDREAREIATKREQILREQSIRTKKHITLDEIGRRLAIGSFKELNVIVKGDVDGSVEALSDSLLKLSTEEVQVNIIHKGVGAISESDVLLASASDAIVIGFQVRPSPSARRLSEQEEIEVRLYSIIYDAINDVKDAMEGMLAPSVEEYITGNVEVREVFKITKVGTVAGCYVTDGIIKRNSKIRLIRDGIVVHSGNISALKRFKDDVAEVRYGYECGISIKNFNDIVEGDIIEGFEEREVKRKL